MLVEARRYRRAALAYCRNGGTIAELARTCVSSQANIEKLLRGKYGFLTAGKARRLESLLSKRGREWVRGAPRWDVSVGMVPVELVRPVIEEGFRRYGRTATATMCGTFERQLFGSLAERKGMQYDVADKVVVSLVGPGWWLLSDERRRWYFNSYAAFGRTPPEHAAAHSARRARHRELVAA